MPQVTGPLTINDGSATPVAVSYSPELLSSSESVFVDRREASRDLQPSIAVNFSRASTNRKTFKVSHIVEFPIPTLVGGAVVSVDVARAKVEYTIPQTMSAQQRKHFRALVANAEALASLKAGVEDLDPLY